MDEQTQLRNLHTSPVEVPIDESVLDAMAQARPDTGNPVPLEERHPEIEEATLSRLLIDGVFGPRKLPRGKYAKQVAERLWEEIDALPPRALIDLPPEIEGEAP